MNPVKAIRKHCVETCCCGSIDEVARCQITSCQLYQFRFGRNPFRTKREMTDEQKAIASERLAKARMKHVDNPSK